VDLTKVEKRLWDKLGQATQAKDANQVSYYNRLALELEGVKRQIAKITQAVEAPHSALPVSSDRDVNAVMWEVTEGAIKQNYLSTTKAVKAGLIDKNAEYEISTSTEQRFKSGVTAAMLSERAEIKKFYQRAAVKPGSMLKLERGEANKLFLSKIDPLQGW
jgi:hypothetical protein